MERKIKTSIENQKKRKDLSSIDEHLCVVSWEKEPFSKNLELRICFSLQTLMRVVREGRVLGLRFEKQNLLFYSVISLNEQ